MTTAQTVRMRVLTRDGAHTIDRPVAVEAPVAVEINGLGYAVMMLTPADLRAFATGFCLTERLIDTAGDLIDVEPADAEAGLVLRVTIAADRADRIRDRVRHRTSDTSCGLCGIAGLEQLHRPVQAGAVAPAATAAGLFDALATLSAHQTLNARTGAVHAAASCDRRGRIDRVFEDVGRHNALDKLVGALAIADTRPDGFILVTSRISYEMVDKALVAQAPMLVGISAPTSMAIAHATAHGLTLIALARADTMLVVNDPFARFG